jgi:hypothetical protein
MKRKFVTAELFHLMPFLGLAVPSRGLKERAERRKTNIKEEPTQSL